MSDVAFGVLYTITLNKVTLHWPKHPAIVTSVLPKLKWLQETQKQAQPTGCPLSHQCPRILRSSYGVLQLIFKLREISSHENWYIYTMRKSHDQWLCTQSQISKRSMHMGNICAQSVGCPCMVCDTWGVHRCILSGYGSLAWQHHSAGECGAQWVLAGFHAEGSSHEGADSHTPHHCQCVGPQCAIHTDSGTSYPYQWTNLQSLLCVSRGAAISSQTYHWWAWQSTSSLLLWGAQIPCRGQSVVDQGTSGDSVKMGWTISAKRGGTVGVLGCSCHVETCA